MMALWLMALFLPTDALLQRARCATQHAMPRIVESCNSALSSEVIRARPPTAAERARVGWTPQTLAMQSVEADADSYVLAVLLGQPSLVDGWYRFPTSIQSERGRCAISVRAMGEVTRWFRFERSTAHPYRPHPDALCPKPDDQAVLVQLCGEVWSEDHGSHLDRVKLATPSWSPQDGVVFEERDWGVRARLDGRSISPAQLETFFGPSAGSKTRRVYRDGPPLSRIGRRCEAEARVKDGVVVEIDAWRAPAFDGSPNAAPDLPKPAQAELARIEARCAAGPDRRRASRDSLGWTQRWPDKDRPLRLAHLLARYGASTVTTQREQLDFMEWVRGVHRFTLPGGRCALQVQITDPTQALTRVRVIWPAAAP